jgi:hypothetical protein
MRFFQKQEDFQRLQKPSPIPAGRPPELSSHLGVLLPLGGRTAVAEQDVGIVATTATLTTLIDVLVAKGVFTPEEFNTPLFAILDRLREVKGKDRDFCNDIAEEMETYLLRE